VITNKIHTTYRQTNAVNGRLQSGGGKQEPDKYNSQNIPRKKKIRECFGTEKGYSLTTLDLEGAEAITMAAKAKDYKLYKLVNGDIHSHLSTIGRKNIFLYRAGDALGLWDNLPDANGEVKRHTMYSKVYNFNYRCKNVKTIESIKKSNKTEVVKNYNSYLTFNVSRTENAERRQSDKNLTFGAVYGCKPKKAAKIIDVSIQEGLIYLNTIKKELPVTFEMVENNVKKALEDGYLVINDRTNSIIWFPSVIDSKKHNYQLDDSSKWEIEGQARNIPISGTQADMLKEAMVEIDSYFVKNKLPCLIIAQVHDELVVKHPTEMTEIPRIVSNIMKTTCNKYLNDFKIETQYNTLLTWTK
jgi:DNA polymerase I-like protein with 3'-5' exonuclease and polymerase domains